MQGDNSVTPLSLYKMKKRSLQFLFLAFWLVFPAGIFAQGNSNWDTSRNSADFSTRISMGLKAGANISNVYDAEGEEFDADAKIGMAAGAFFQIPIGSVLGFHPEVMFSQKGYQGSGSVLGSEYNYIRTTNLIDVPLLLAFKAGPMFTLVLGPQYSYLISQKYFLHTALGDINREEHFENENLGKNTLGLSGGFDLNLSHLVLSARGGWDILNNKGDGTSTTPRYKNRLVQVTLGYRF